AGGRACGGCPRASAAPAGQARGGRSGSSWRLPTPRQAGRQNASPNLFDEASCQVGRSLVLQILAGVGIGAVAARSDIGQRIAADRCLGTLGQLGRMLLGSAARRDQRLLQLLLLRAERGVAAGGGDA